MSGFDDNPFGEPTIDNPFAVSFLKKSFQLITLIIGIRMFENQLNMTCLLGNMFDFRIHQYNKLLKTQMPN